MVVGAGACMNGVYALRKSVSNIGMSVHDGLKDTSLSRGKVPLDQLPEGRGE